MPEAEGKLAVVLLSGGLDSATTLAVAREGGFRCHALSFDYGQRHRGFELPSAGRIARAMGVLEHRVICIDLSAEAGFGHSALTDDIPVPKDRLAAPPGGRRPLPVNPRGAGREARSSIPATYVPARNTIFLAFALGYAEGIGAFDIFIGANAIDYSGYPDCRGEFLEAFQRLADLGTAAGVEGRGRFTIHAPLLRMTKGQIIRTGLGLGVDYSRTHSCYDPSAEGLACGRCDSCRLRLAGFAQAGAQDPIQYQQE